jgi:hypothetical protein
MPQNTLTENTDTLPFQSHLLDRESPKTVLENMRSDSDKLLQSIKIHLADQFDRWLLQNPSQADLQNSLFIPYLSPELAKDFLASFTKDPSSFRIVVENNTSSPVFFISWNGERLELTRPMLQSLQSTRFFTQERIIFAQMVARDEASMYYRDTKPERVEIPNEPTIIPTLDPKVEDLSRAGLQKIKAYLAWVLQNGGALSSNWTPVDSKKFSSDAYELHMIREHDGTYSLYIQTSEVWNWQWEVDSNVLKQFDMSQVPKNELDAIYKYADYAATMSQLESAGYLWNSTQFRQFPEIWIQYGIITVK